MSKARVSRLRGIALAAPKATEAAGFYVDSWGLREVARQPGAVYLRASGPEHHVLSLHESDRKGIAHLHFAAQDIDGLKALHEHAKSVGARIVAPLGALGTPGGGMGFELADPENRRLRISAAVANRSCGCLASARATTASSSFETCSRREASDGIIAFKWFARISVVDPAKNGVL